MPCIFDNIEQELLFALRETLAVAGYADFYRIYSKRAVVVIKPGK